MESESNQSQGAGIMISFSNSRCYHREVAPASGHVGRKIRRTACGIFEDSGFRFSSLQISKIERDYPYSKRACKKCFRKGTK